MPLYSYRATDKQARDLSGIVEAESIALAIHQVRKMGYFPVQVKEDAGKSARRLQAKSEGFIPTLGKRVKRKHITLMTRQLATLIDAGLPLLRCLSILHHQQKTGRLRSILDELINDVEGGSSFSEALAKHPKVFDRLYVNMVRAGEVGGLLEVVLKRLAEFAERREALARKVKGAMVYPVTVLLVAGCVVAFLLIRVVPVFEEIFIDFGNPLPKPTMFLINVSNALRHSISWILIAIASMVVGIRLIRRIGFLKTLGDRIALKLPVFGEIVRKTAVARFSRTLGTLVASGVPILQSFSIVRETVGNRVVANAIGEVHDSVREGESIAGPLERSNAFPYMAVNMIDVGEETGNLDAMLLKIADIYDSEVDASIGAMLQIIEPAMVVVLGLIVGFIVVAMYLPIINMAGFI